jgi:hypothetical protein
MGEKKRALRTDTQYVTKEVTHSLDSRVVLAW